MDLGVFLEVKPILFTLIFMGLTAIAIWLGSIYWVYQDIFSRTNNIILSIGSIILAAVLPFTGLVVYMLIRPSLTVEEARYQRLEEKMFIRQLKEMRTCPKCKKSTEKDYIYCPHCKTKLRDSCPKCDRIVEKNHNICPYCGYELKEGAHTGSSHQNSSSNFTKTKVGKQSQDKSTSTKKKNKK